MTASAAERLELRAARSHCVNFGKTTQNINMDTLQLHWTYVYNLEGRGFVTARPLYNNAFRITVSKTISEITIFERAMTPTGQGFFPRVVGGIFYQ